MTGTVLHSDNIVMGGKSPHQFRRNLNVRELGDVVKHHRKSGSAGNLCEITVKYFLIHSILVIRRDADQDRIDSEPFTFFEKIRSFNQGRGGYPYQEIPVSRDDRTRTPNNLQFLSRIQMRCLAVGSQQKKPGRRSLEILAQVLFQDLIENFFFRGKGSGNRGNDALEFGVRRHRLRVNLQDLPLAD
jgi:hypothetical protein